MSENKAVLEVLKASAGSGKTFTLVRRILKVLIQEKNPHYYKHILALTFTNAAAQEMKERVIQTLEELSENPENSSMLGMILSDTGLKTTEVKYRAQKIIKSILHNYSDLSIMTIDSFTHKLVRSFAQELNLRSDFNLEFSQKDLLNEGVDQVMSDIGFKKEITQLIRKQVLMLVQESDKWNLDRDLKNEVESLVSERFLESIERFDEEELNDFLEKVRKFKSTYQKEALLRLEKSLEVISLNKLTHDEFSGKTRSGIKNKLEKKVINQDYAPIQYNKDKILSKPAKESHGEHVEHAIISKMDEFNVFVEEYREKYMEANIILQNENLLKLSKPILEKFTELKDQQNLVFINDFHKMIYDMVRNEPAPFIFEKIGVRYKHFFLDEFQDTSVRQWSNLSGLVHDGISQDNYSLIVGDAKQSIYRWREGKVEQFVDLPGLYNPSTDEELLRDAYFKRRGIVNTLETNYRSRSEVISFNNQLFSDLSISLEDTYLQEVFQDVKQEFSGQEGKLGGYVSYEVLEDVDADVKAKWAFDIIKDKLNHGFDPCDISILLRSNKDIQKVTIALKDLLDENGLQKVGIYSSDSYTLESFGVIRLIMLVLNNFYEEWDTSTEISFIQYYLDSKGKPQDGVFKYIHYNDEGQRVVRFQEFLTQHKIKVVHNEGFVSLYHLLEEVLLKLNLEANNHPAVQLMLDEALNYGRLKTAELYNFLKYYEENLKTKKVETTPSVNNITVQTVHRSKGLQYPIVLIPGVDFKPKAGSKIDFIPKEWENGPVVKTSGSKENLELSGGREAKLEKGFSMLEDLNMLYVACTRAVDELYVLGKTSYRSEMTRSGTPKSNHSGDIQKQLNEVLGVTNESPHVERGRKIVKNKVEHQSIESINIESYKGFGRGNIAVHATKELTGEVNVSERGLGVYFHEAMRLKLVGEGDKLIEYLDSCPIEDQQRKDLLSKVNQALNNETFKVILETKGDHLLEKAILTPEGTVLRPDMVKVQETSVVLIDYKTGIPSGKDVKQINSYKNVLQKIYPDKEMTGYIYYVSMDEMSLC